MTVKGHGAGEPPSGNSSSRKRSSRKRSSAGEGSRASRWRRWQTWQYPVRCGWPDAAARWARNSARVSCLVVDAVTHTTPRCGPRDAMSVGPFCLGTPGC